MLSVLTPEARTLVLATMPPAQRWHIMEAMRDEDRAEIVVAMGLDMRKDAAAALSGRTWERTIDIIKNSGTHAARYASGGEVRCQVNPGLGICRWPPQLAHTLPCKADALYTAVEAYDVCSINVHTDQVCRGHLPPNSLADLQTWPWRSVTKTST
jgi:hypothetical protein